MGLAMVIIYKTSEVVNFAQGEMALISIFSHLHGRRISRLSILRGLPGALSLLSCSVSP